MWSTVHIVSRDEIGMKGRNHLSYSAISFHYPLRLTPDLNIGLVSICIIIQKVKAESQTSMKTSLVQWAKCGREKDNDGRSNEVYSYSDSSLALQLGD
jgi:hypothetical protein